MVRSRRDFEPQLINGTLWKLGLKMSDEADDIVTLIQQVDLFGIALLLLGNIFKGRDVDGPDLFGLYQTVLNPGMGIYYIHVEKLRFGCIWDTTSCGCCRALQLLLVVGAVNMMPCSGVVLVMDYQQLFQ